MSVPMIGVLNNQQQKDQQHILMRTTENMKDKKAAKKLIKRAKLNRNWYTPEEVKYAKMMKRQLEKITVNPEEPRL